MQKILINFNFRTIQVLQGYELTFIWQNFGFNCKIICLGWLFINIMEDLELNKKNDCKNEALFNM